MVRLKKRWYKVESTPKQLPGTTEMYWLIDCDYTIGVWIETSDKHYWRSPVGHHLGIYWVNEQLLTIIALQWPD